MVYVGHMEICFRDFISMTVCVYVGHMEICFHDFISMTVHGICWSYGNMFS